ncbi:uncharacterized protein MELLADRAFT_116417 [Melampsora larici-populina 98AG31]|uniref:Uncharacterized protein n=1 Tax=Melampsora larici-populina (strain 98AG31 / pathotype 3-4-7) TaxID=747676 RepID=F4RKX4_MELLP|nr:uncharacterized protein MELLADRAFT_116417 [Melampsora larici-populina 98AG31]EGG06961.1 hypothetical protein MELLADRAFT_116417 [Melampsora larici-populina 98AG31]
MSFSFTRPQTTKEIINTSEFITSITPDSNTRFLNKIKSKLMISKLYNFFSSLNNLRTTFQISSLIVFDLFQMISFLVILILTKAQNCDQPLKIYLTMYLMKISLTLPIKVYFNFIEFKQSGINQDSNDSNDDDDHEFEYHFYLQLLYDFLKTISWVWFLMGNLLILNSTTCSKTSPLLYFSSLTSLIILGYFYLMEIFLILLTLNFFVPVTNFIIKSFNTIKRNKTIDRPDEVLINQTPIMIHLTQLEEFKWNHQMFQKERKEFDLELGLSEEDDQLWIPSILIQNQPHFALNDQFNQLSLQFPKLKSFLKLFKSLKIIWNQQSNFSSSTSYQFLNQDEKVSFQEIHSSYPIEKPPNSDPMI